jgi:hypothetical protein
MSACERHLAGEGGRDRGCDALVRDMQQREAGLALEALEQEARPAA